MSALSGFVKGMGGITTMGGHGAKVVSQGIKLDNPEDPTFWTYLGPVWTPFPQVGTWLGAEGVPALAMDIAFDPFTWLNPVGGLTKAGRSAKMFRAILGTEKAEKVASQAADLMKVGRIAEAKDLQKTYVLEALAENVGLASRLRGDDYYELYQAIRTSPNDLETLRTLREIQAKRIKATYGALGNETAHHAHRDAVWAYQEAGHVVGEAEAELKKAKKALEGAQGKVDPNVTAEKVRELEEDLAHWQNLQRDFANEVKEASKKNIDVLNKEMQSLQSEIDDLEYEYDLEIGKGGGPQESALQILERAGVLDDTGPKTGIHSSGSKRLNFTGEDPKVSYEEWKRLSPLLLENEDRSRRAYEEWLKITAGHGQPNLYQSDIWGTHFGDLGAAYQNLVRHLGPSKVLEGEGFLHQLGVKAKKVLWVPEDHADFFKLHELPKSDINPSSFQKIPEDAAEIIANLQVQANQNIKKELAAFVALVQNGYIKSDDIKAINSLLVDHRYNLVRGEISKVLEREGIDLIGYVNGAEKQGSISFSIPDWAMNDKAKTPIVSQKLIPSSDVPEEIRRIFASKIGGDVEDLPDEAKKALEALTPKEGPVLTTTQRAIIVGEIRKKNFIASIEKVLKPKMAEVSKSAKGGTKATRQAAAAELKRLRAAQKSIEKEMEGLQTLDKALEYHLSEVDPIKADKALKAERAEHLKEVRKAQSEYRAFRDHARDMVKEAKAELKKVAKAGASAKRLESAARMVMHWEKTLERLEVQHDAALLIVKDTAKEVRAKIAKSITGRDSPFEFRNDSSSFTINAVRAGMVEEKAQGAGRMGTERALGWLNQVEDQRKELRRAAAGALTIESRADLNRLSEIVMRLSPDARMTRIFRENRKNLEAMIDSVLEGELINPMGRAPGLGVEGSAPRFAGQLKRDVQAGHRKLINFSAFGHELGGFGGEKVMDAFERMVRSARRIPDNKPLVMGKRGAGLVDASLHSTVRMQEALGADSAIASADTLYDALSQAGDAARGLSADYWRFQGMSEAFAHEIARAEFFGSRIIPEMQSAFRNHGLDLEKDGLKIMQLVDNPSAFLKMTKAGKGRVLGQRTYFTAAAELTERAKNLGYTDAHLYMAEAIDSALRGAQNVLKEERLVQSFLDFYMPRVVRIIKRDEWDAAKASGIGKRLEKKFFEHGQARVLGTLDELLELEKKGVIEVEKSIDKILASYFSATGRSAATQRLYQRAREIKLPMGSAPIKDAGETFLKDHPEGLPLFVEPESKVHKLFANEYVELSANRKADLSVLNMAESVEAKPNMFGDTRKLVVGKGGNRRVMVKKEYAHHMRSLADPAQTGDIQGFLRPGTESAGERLFNASLAINAAQKRGLLFWSMFHHMALTESAIADLGADFLPQVLRFWQGGKPLGMGARLARGEKSFFEAADIMETATRAGLQLGAVADVEADIFHRTMRAIGRKIPQAAPATTMIAAQEMRWNKGLWDFYHNGLKLFAYNTLYSRALARHGHLATTAGTNVSRQVAKAVAEHVNNAFGGQMWSAFWTSKLGLQWARNLWLAPDWTASNLKVAGDVFGNWTKRLTSGARGFGGGLSNLSPMFTVTADDLFRADVRAVFARQYALRAGLILGVFQNFVNLAFTGHFMDQNPEGHRLQVQLPWKDEKGRGQFLRMGKQFREPLEFLGITDGNFFDMLFRRKLSGVAGMIHPIFGGTDYYGRPITTAENGPLMYLLKRSGIYGITKATVPITFQNAYKGVVEGRPVSGIAGAASGFVGLPWKTEFRKGSRGEVDPTLVAALMEMGLDAQDPHPEIAPIFYEATDAMIRDGTFEKDQEKVFKIRGF